jgi:tetratricopeptide (TPR) repeat protein
MMKIDIHSDPPTSEQVAATKDKEKFRRKFILIFLVFGILLSFLVCLFLVLTAEDIVALAGALGVLIIWLGYQKDKTESPKAKEVLGKRILYLTIAVAVVNGVVVPLINHLLPKPPPAVTDQYIDEKFRDYFGEKPKNPPVEEVKSEIEKELEEAKNKALELYELGDKAYDSNEFKDAVKYFQATIEIYDEIPVVHLSLGNSLLVTSDFMAAKTAYQTALALYRSSKDRKGEGGVLGNLGVAYHSLGQYDKAKDHYKKAIMIFEEIKSPHVEIVRKNLAELEATAK